MFWQAQIHTFLSASSTHLPLGFLPALAVASTAMLSEVTYHMIKTTPRLNLRSSSPSPAPLNIATWFRDFRAAVTRVQHSVTHLAFC